jgi:Neuraminidase (sialidase)
MSEEGQMSEKNEPVTVSEDSAVTIPLRNLISLLGAVAMAVWGYSELNGRISSLESENVMINQAIKDLQQANRDAATGIDPWATDVQQTTRIDRTEKDVQRIEELYLQRQERNSSCVNSCEK